MTETGKQSAGVGLLNQKLREYAASGPYPFHMPGHKRQSLGNGDPYTIDITEIAGFDNLHHAEGILKGAQQRAADLYRARRAWYLINGSTCGLLAAISAAVPKHSKVLVARNCHKAVYHALYLRELYPEYIFPELTGFGLQGMITVESVRRAIKKHPDAKALILTSPTYDGVVSDIASLAGLVHENGMVLIVDQAHGAHFGLDQPTEPEPVRIEADTNTSENPGSGIGTRGFPQNAGLLGADLVIVSVHKTLPAFTQTALLLSYSERVADRRIADFLDIYETSSPSYILMAGIDTCISFMSEQGSGALRLLRRRLDDFYREVRGLGKLRVLTREDFLADGAAHDFDESKILILTSGSGLSGAALADILRKDYCIELEMASGTYALALASLMDSREGFARLAGALQEIDRQLLCREAEASGEIFTPREIYGPRERRLDLYKAEDQELMALPAEQAVGQVSGVYIYLYPPGIPLVVPGEVIPEGLPAWVRAAAEAGIEVDGLDENEQICIVKNFPL